MTETTKYDIGWGDVTTKTFQPYPTGKTKRATDDQVEAFAECYGVLPDERLRWALTVAIMQGDKQ